MKVVDKNIRELIVRFLESKDHDSLGALFSVFVHSLYRVALSICHNETDAEDVVQKVFITILKKSDQFHFDRDSDNLESSFQAWITMICVNGSKMHLRKKHLDQDLTKKYKKMEQEEVREIDAGLLASVEEVLAKLPVRYSLPIKLRYQEGLSYDDISTALSSKPSTIRSQISRGLEIIRGKLGGSAKAIGILALIKLISNEELQAAPPGLLKKCYSLKGSKTIQVIDISKPVLANSFHSKFFGMILLLSAALAFIWKWPLLVAPFSNKEMIVPNINSLAAENVVVKKSDVWDFSKDNHPEIKPILGKWVFDDKRGFLGLDPADYKGKSSIGALQLPEKYAFRQKFTVHLKVRQDYFDLSDNLNGYFIMLPQGHLEALAYERVMYVGKNRFIDKELAKEFAAEMYFLDDYVLYYSKGLGTSVLKATKKNLSKQFFNLEVQDVDIRKIERKELDKDSLRSLEIRLRPFKGAIKEELMQLIKSTAEQLKN